MKPTAVKVYSMDGILILPQYAVQEFPLSQTSFSSCYRHLLKDGSHFCLKSKASVVLNIQKNPWICKQAFGVTADLYRWIVDLPTKLNQNQDTDTVKQLLWLITESSPLLNLSASSDHRQLCISRIYVQYNVYV